MPEVKNKNIRKRNHNLLRGLLIVLFFITYVTIPVTAQVELNFSKWQDLKSNKYISLAFAKTAKINLLDSPTKNRISTFKSVNTYQVQPLPGVGQYRELGFFCKLDLRLDKTMNMPFRFRLGNLEYVNKLEGYWR